MKAIAGLVIGFTAGAVTMAMRPKVAPMFTEVARPLTKVLLKRSRLGLERLRTGIARGSESIEDLLAEVRAEVDTELARGQAGNDSRSVSSVEIKAVDAESEQPEAPTGRTARSPTPD